MKKLMYLIPGLILATLILVIIAGVAVRNRNNDEVGESDLELYYISTEGYSFTKVPYIFMRKENTVTMAEEVLKQLKTIPSDTECLPSVPQEIMWTDITLENNNLIIDFITEYQNLDSRKEIFLRSSVVKSLVQIEEIRTVEFKVGGTPLMALNTQPVGMMDEDDFIDGTEENWGVNQQENITLYFADKSGKKLTIKEVDITVVNNISMEQLIVEELINNEKYLSPIPEGTKVLKAVTKDQICYLDLSKEFLNPMDEVSGEVTIYAIVNSLVERAGVNKVQFTVEGKTINNYRSNLDLSLPISRNLDLAGK